MEVTVSNRQFEADIDSGGDAERMLSWCVPTDIQVLTVFVCGTKTDKVSASRAHITNGYLDVSTTVKKVCAGMPAYKYVTAGVLALAGTHGDVAKVQPTEIARHYKWPKTIRAISSLDTLVVIARRQPRICLTRRHLVSGVRRRRTRRRAASSKIETA